MNCLWVDVNNYLPLNARDGFNGNVVGIIAPYGDLKRTIFVDLVHFDGSDWYDIHSKPCRVTHWKPLSIE
tara:strand:+ start:488 stop:697 length:210 start_codon:yes stop_codon:yes gene_type:complete